MNDYPGYRQEIEKPKPAPKNLMQLLDSMDAWLRNDTPIQGLILEDVIEWREALAKHLNVTADWLSSEQAKERNGKDESSRSGD